MCSSDLPALTTDVIVGFPGESKEEFEASRKFVDEIDFYETHIFKYSKRQGTKAAAMPQQVDEQVKSQRSAKMLSLDEEKRKKYENYWIGKEVEVLVEEETEIEGRRFWIGHTKEYMKILIESEENLQNTIIRVQIKNHSQIIH